jgi:hypothetical protein
MWNWLKELFEEEVTESFNEPNLSKYKVITKEISVDLKAQTYIIYTIDGKKYLTTLYEEARIEEQKLEKGKSSSFQFGYVKLDHTKKMLTYISDCHLRASNNIAIVFKSDKTDRQITLPIHQLKRIVSEPAFVWDTIVYTTEEVIENK